MGILISGESLKDNDGCKAINAPKFETIITAICVNGHENEIRPEALDQVWYFKCSTCGTIYVQSSKASTHEVKEG